MGKLFIDVLSFDDCTYCFDIEQIEYIKKHKTKTTQIFLKCGLDILIREDYQSFINRLKTN
ncbi:hypothetical protein UFOVP387_4 [uncultured Caudovirales phage]|uniref:Uncharacterized protein n=1 Tax=uncultured Caudovirales phage TaxID=2100421 RepID=A0A6J7X0L6_9CAUD|nr:hypothetical protein UFOVP387_4 [uncultured Caudovirales phage]